MDDAKGIVSAWQSLLSEFRGVFTLGGWARFTSTGVLDRVTTMQYDWRGRQTATLGEEGFCEVRFYDNLDRGVLPASVRESF